MSNKNTKPIAVEQLLPAFAASARYERRQARIEHPSGSFDNAKRWYPSGRDEEVIDAGRAPSRSYPNAYNTASRSLAHCERLDEADHQVVLRLKRELKRYFAYERKSGETCYVNKARHQHLQRYPHTIAYYQLSRWLSTSALLTAQQAAVQGWLSKSRTSSS